MVTFPALKMHAHTQISLVVQFRRLFSEDKTSGSVMQVSNWKDLPVSWVKQMKNKGSEEHSKGSDFVEQNYLEKQL